MPHVALLRAINLASRRRVDMGRLRAAFEELGHGEVRTHMQSGNVVFSAAAPDPDAIVAELETCLAAAFGFPIMVILRSGDELAEIVAANPLRSVATDPARHLVIFRKAAVETDRLEHARTSDFAPEAFAVRGREIFIWAPSGVQSSPIVKALSERKLGGVASARNWRTVERLAELASGGAGSG